MTRAWNTLLLVAMLLPGLAIVAARAWHLAVAVERRLDLAPVFVAFACGALVLSFPARIREVWRA